MKTIIKLRVLNKRTRELAILYKDYEGFMALPVDSTVITGIWMCRVQNLVFDATKNVLVVNLKEEVEEDKHFYERIALIKNYGWY